MSAHAAPGAPLWPRTRAAPGVPRSVARLVAFAGLGLFGALHWSDMAEPSASGRMVGMLALALAGGAALQLLARLARPGLRRAGQAATGVALLASVLLAAGVDGRFLEPRAWDELAAGLGQGIFALPNVRIPYRGLEEWTLQTLLAGGGALLALAAVLAFLPRPDGALPNPVPAAVALGAVYAVPAVQLQSETPWTTGVAFALLLAAFLWLDRVRRDAAPPAVILVLVAVLAGLVAAPRVDRDGPLLDYEELAESIAASGSTEFTWRHSYGPLNWPRDGREVLRIRAGSSSYWKATNLVEFDGITWTDRQVLDPYRDDTEYASGHPEWFGTLRVTVRNLQTPSFVTAGTAQAIVRSPRLAIPASPGTFRTGRRPLRRGHAYQARVYTPRPSARQLAEAPSLYPSFTRQYLSMALPAQAGGPVYRNRVTRLPDKDLSAEVTFRPWHEDDATPLAREPSFLVTGDTGGDLLRRSRYARTYALARTLRADATTPYEYVRAVQRHLSRGFTYTETPPGSDVPLETFLWRDKAGYCQQFSGAMALLLRMGGVPARVATGFSPGTYDRKRREFVVRDLDAHSWVEAYFPGYGWIPFDPTPASAPPRAQATSDLVPSAAGGDATDLGPSPRAADPAGGGGAVAEEGPPWALLGGAAGAALAAAGVAAAVVLARRRRRRAEARGEDVALAELVRALARTGRAPAAGTTLQALARRFRGTPAEDYVRALLARRYGFAGRAPTKEQRAGLRRELSAGLGPMGRLRAWWAVPPRL